MNKISQLFLNVSAFFALLASLPAQNLYPVRVDGKWAYVDENQKTIIDPQFEFASAFSEGFALVTKNGLKTFIDLQGQMVFPPRYKDAYSFRNGFARVLRDSLWIFIDKTGRERFLPGFELCRDFSEGMAVVSRDGYYSYIDTLNVFKVDYQYDMVDDFHYRLARVKQDDAYFFIGQDGKKKSRSYEYAGPVMKGGFAYVYRDAYWSVVDTAFRLLWNEDFEYFSTKWDADTMACAYGLFVGLDGDKIDIDLCAEGAENKPFVRFRDSVDHQGRKIRYAVKISPLPGKKYHIRLMPEDPDMRLGFFVKGMGGRHQESTRQSDLLHTHTFTPAYYELSLIVLAPDPDFPDEWIEEGILKTYRLFPRSPFD